MDPGDVPPPYTDAPKMPLPFEGQGRQGSGYPSPSSPTFVPTYMSAPPQQPSTMTTVTVSGAPGRGPFVPGSCPVCSGTSWTGTYSCLAWLLCWFCFWNCGLCCCLCMRKKKCTKCGFTLS